MSIPGGTPFYILAAKRPDGMIDYALFNPRGLGADQLVHVAPCAARDEEQARGRVQDLVPPWQESIEVRAVAENVLRGHIAAWTELVERPGHDPVWKARGKMG